MKISTLLLTLCSAWLLIPHLQAVASPNQPSPPNILIIIADDMSKQHAGIYGDRAVATPFIDALGNDGVVFDNAFCTAPSCTASRGSILTGRYPHQLGEGGNLWSTLPVEFPNYTTLLEEKGYTVGLTGKGWGPGDFRQGGYIHNPAGPAFESFNAFIDALPAGNPFCFWLGSHDPHRPYDPELRKTVAFDTSAVALPAWLPDSPHVREDLLDYYAEVERFDETVGAAIAILKKNGLYDNTLIIVTSDNGMPFPRAKANVYDAGTNVPLIMRWGEHFRNGSRYEELVSLVDVAPTILDVANRAIPRTMSGESLLPLLLEGESGDRFSAVFLERERHANVRRDHSGYPMRAIRTKDYLLILNLRPDRWPAGDPDLGRGFGDVDNGLSKDFLMSHRTDPAIAMLADLSFAKRPYEELYDVRKDPDQLINLADDPSRQREKSRLVKALSRWRKRTGDPVQVSGSDVFDTYPYYGGKNRPKR